MLNLVCTVYSHLVHTIYYIMLNLVHTIYYIMLNLLHTVCNITIISMYISIMLKKNEDRPLLIKVR